MHRGLNIETVRRNKVAILHLEGTFTDLEVYKVSSEADRQCQDGIRYLILDLLKVGFIDSAGIGIINAVRVKMEQKHGTLLIVRSSGQTLARVLDQCVVFKLVRLFEDTQTALKEIPSACGGTMDDAVSPGPPCACTERLQQFDTRLAQLEAQVFRLTNSTLAD